MLDQIGNQLRIAALRRRGAQIGAGVTLAPGASIKADRIVIGDACHIADAACIRAQSVTIGAYSHVGAGCRLEAPRIDIGYNCILFSGVDIRVRETFSIGPHGKMSRMVTVRGSTIEIGREFWMNAGAEIGGGSSSSPESAFKAGDRCHIGRSSHVNIASLVRLGDDTAIGMDCILATHAYWQAYTDGYPRRRGPIHLGSSVALYSRCVIGPGVTIGDGSIVAAGSVVTRDIAPGMLAGGAPARVLQSAKEDCDPTERLKSLLKEFVARHEHQAVVQAVGDHLIVTATREGQQILLAATPDARTHLAHGAIVLTVDADTTTALLGGSQSAFDVGNKILHGTSSALSEALRNFLFSAGLRFKYNGYQRSRLDYHALVATGMERP